MTAPLRIGLIIDSVAQPRWVRACVEKMLATNIVSLELVARANQQQNDSRGLLFQLYDRVDRMLFAADALEPVSVEDLLKGRFVEDGFERIKNAQLDVIINFGPIDCAAELADTATYGIWFYFFEDALGFQDGNDGHTMVSELRRRKGDREQVIYRSVSPLLSKFSARLNRNTIYWKSAAFVARSLKDIHAGRPIESLEVNSPSSLEHPTNGAMLEMFLKFSARGVSRTVEKLSFFQQWILAYRIAHGEFRYLIPESNHFWADPFPLKVNGKQYIFFEDYVYDAGRAHISVVEVDQNGIVSGPTEALKLDSHLSYPFVFEWQGDYYMIPETGERNVVELYRAASAPFDWQPVKVLVEANCPLDATVIEVEGTWWMFVNIQEEGAMVNWDELHLYYSESLFGPWKPHARNPVVSDVRSARPAGRLFWSNNVLYRPSQDSSRSYGYATTINEVEILTPQDYSEKEVHKILPVWDRRTIGVHTFNCVGDITVIDVLIQRNKFGAEPHLNSIRMDI